MGHHLPNDEAALQDFTLRFRGSVVKGLGRDFVLSSTCLSMRQIENSLAGSSETGSIRNHEKVFCDPVSDSHVDRSDLRMGGLRCTSPPGS